MVDRPASPVAIVAGAGGAGAATSAALAAVGFTVVILDSRAESADAISTALTDDGFHAEAHEVDLLDVAAVQALREDVLARLGPVDVLVHLVGGWRGTSTLEVSSVDNWNALHPPIVGTLAVLTAVFGDDVRRSPRGRAFMVTSTTAAHPTAGNIAYAAAKSAAEAWMTGVAHFLRESDAASVTVAVKALLTDPMITAEPDRDWAGHTHVTLLGDAIARACAGPIANGTRLDLTSGEYSGS
jgi:NAD(P)-dependent dehydrogenase (short-subunit alcohol dehydrogenase family)